MKKLLLYASILFFIACNSDIKEEFTVEHSVESDYVLTENEAIATLEDFIESMPGTRSSSSLKIVSCEKRTASDFGDNTGIVTRSSSEGIDVNSVPVYEIKTNSDDGSGFGLVLGDKRFNEVIAFSPKGSLSDTVFNEGLALFAASIPILIYESLVVEREQEKQITRADYWQPEPSEGKSAYITDWDNPRIIDGFKSYDEAYAAYPTYFLPWDTYETPVRYVPVKWHQQAPYNNRVPQLCDGVRGKVGCGAVALAQIMAYHKHPNVYNWALITSSQQVNTSHTIAANEVSRLMIDLATATNTSFYCKNDGLGGSAGSTSASSYVPAFSRFGYSANYLYSKAEKVSSQKVRDGIVNYGPVLMAASNSTLNGVPTGGHAWVVDGFYKKSRDYRQISSGATGAGVKYAYVTIYRQHFVTLHCNWGWGGSSDGWYYNFTPINEQYKFASFHLWTVTPNA